MEQAKRKCEIAVSTLGRRYYLSFGATRSRNEYKTFAGAVRSAIRKGYEVITTVDPMIEFKKNDGKTKIVQNLLSGKLVRVAVNTPACCDPSTETYWSM
jgi:hypothetical protein